MSKIYCGAGKVPKSKRRGTMKECIEMGRVGYYGLNKVDKKLMEHMTSKKKDTSSKSDLIAKRTKLRVEYKKLKLLITKEYDETKKNKLKAVANKKKADLLKISKKLEKMK